MTNPTPKPETIEKLTSAVFPSLAMLAGMELDLFTPLKDGPMAANQIAEALSVRQDKLRPLLYALVAAGLLTLNGELFANSAEADHYFVRGKPSYRGGTHGAIRSRWENVLHTAETIRTGVPQRRTDFSRMGPDQMRARARSRETDNTNAARELMERYDFSLFRSLLDVGGGAGYLSIAITEAFPELEATVVDLPTAISEARLVVAEMGAENRVQVVAADVVNDPITGNFDVAILRHLIQVLSPEQARLAIINAVQAVKTGGTVYIIGRILDNSRVSPLDVVGLNLNFLNLYDHGQAYTEQEHVDWLSEAGIEGCERITDSDGNGIISGRKKSA